MMTATAATTTTNPKAAHFHVFGAFGNGGSAGGLPDASSKSAMSVSLARRTPAVAAATRLLDPLGPLLGRWVLHLG